MYNILLFFLISSFSFSQENKIKNHVSLGLFDHKTGLSVVGYSRTLWKDTKNEIFLGVGTSFIVNSLTVGAKKYLFKGYVDGYVVLGGQILSLELTDDTNKTIWLAAGIEKLLIKNFFINLGVLSPILYDSVIGAPNINLSFRF